MSSAVEPVNNFETNSRPAREIASSHLARARRSVSAARQKRAKPDLFGPTPERLAKGDIKPMVGTHRAVSSIERLRDQGKLDHMPHVNQGMFEAAEKLRRHFDSCMIGVRAQDVSRTVTSSSAEGLAGEEMWVHHFDTFRKACKLMGWSEASPHRGAGRLVVAVVCQEQTVHQAAVAHIGSGRTETVMAAGMDRLREGLFALATLWRLC